MFKGAQVLLLSLILLLLVGVLAASSLYIWERVVEVPSLQELNMHAFYLAEAGVERGKAEVLLMADDLCGTGTASCPGSDSASANCPASPDPIGYTDLDDPDDNYVFYYRFDLTAGGNPDSTLEREITGWGQVRDLANNILAHREIKCLVDGIRDRDDAGGDANDADDGGGFGDDGVGTLQEWGWYEQ